MKYLIKCVLESKNVYVKTLIPYISFLILNFLLIRLNFPGLTFAFILDTVVGLLLLKYNKEKNFILHVIDLINKGDIKAKAGTEFAFGGNKRLAESINSIGDVIETAVEQSIKDERLKASLITNVSHDIKTPLTSIINYVGLIKREKPENENVRKYIDILENKSNKLKNLTEDLVEASKITSGNVSAELIKIDLVELINQSIGEYYEKFEERNLKVVFRKSKRNIYIIADPKHLWRVVENIFGNACKYALCGTTLCVELSELCDKAVLTFKNVSLKEIRIEEDELSERFVRGDESRTTEGYGLGLSIAKSLTEIQGGEFTVRLDGDLFRAIISIPLCKD